MKCYRKRDGLDVYYVDEYQNELKPYSLDGPNEEQVKVLQEYVDLYETMKNEPDDERYDEWYDELATHPAQEVLQDIVGGREGLDDTQIGAYDIDNWYEDICSVLYF